MTWSDHGFDSCAKLCDRDLRGNTLLHSARTLLQQCSGQCPRAKNPVDSVGMATRIVFESVKNLELKISLESSPDSVSFWGSYFKYRKSCMCAFSSCACAYLSLGARATAGRCCCALGSLGAGALVPLQGCHCCMRLGCRYYAWVVGAPCSLGAGAAAAVCLGAWALVPLQGADCVHCGACVLVLRPDVWLVPQKSFCYLGSMLA